MMRVKVVSDCDEEEFIFNAFVDLEPVLRSEDRCDMRIFRSFNPSTCKAVLDMQPDY